MEEVKNTSMEISEEQISEITLGEESEIDLKNLESLVVERKTQIYQNDHEYEFHGKKERADVFIKNYMMKFDMHNSLKILEQELFELLSKGEIDIDSIPNVPDVYIKCEKLQEDIGHIQKQLDDAKIYAERAKSLHQKLFKAKENEKIRHRRIQQEKQKLIKDIEKMKKVYEQDGSIYKELKKKHLNVTNKSLIIEQNLKGLKSRIESLDTESEELKKRLEDAKKQLGEIDIKKEKQSEIIMEKKGSKIISWTPFPTPPKYIPDFTSQTPSTKISIANTFPGHLASITSVDFHPKKAIFGTTSDDKTWKLWKYPNGELLMHGEGHKDWVSSISFHPDPDGSLLATCGGDATIKIWDIAEEKCVHTIIDHAQPVWKNKFNYSGLFLLTACMDHTVRLFDMNNFKCRMSYRAHVDSVNAINFLYMSNNFLSGSADKTISMWDMRQTSCTQTYYGHFNSVNSVNCNPRGDMIVSCDSDGVVKIWDVRMIKEIQSFNNSKQSANCLTIDKSGSLIIVGYDDSNIRIFNTKSLKMETIYKAHEDAVLDLTYDPFNKALVTCGADQSFRLWK